MRILAIDVGTGTQDILLFDSAQTLENALQLIMPSPTQIAAGRIRRATEGGRAVFLTGAVAGGGPCHWALEDHLRAGAPAFATHEAAATFDDDLENVERMGVTLVSEDEAKSLDAQRVELRAVNPDAIRAFAFRPEELPDSLTRARTLVACADTGVPVVFLDTGPAAALGALQDPEVAQSDKQLILNLGNMHALAFHVRGTQILSLYEHHTGEMEVGQIEDFTERLMAGTLAHEEVFGSKGHGVYYAEEPGARSKEQGRQPLISVTGPQRSRLRGSRLEPYFAAPHGDMMGAGCFGLLWAFAEKYPEHREEITAALGVVATDAAVGL